MIKTGDTILFQGDSITNAFRKPEEINLSFQLGAGYAFLIAAGILLEYPIANLKFINRGESGDNIGRLFVRWQSDCIELKPDIISILAGVNDVLQGVPYLESEQNYRVLLKTTRLASPASRLVLMEPFLLSCGSVTPEKKKNIMSIQILIRQLAQEFDALFIPLQARFEDAARTNCPEHYSYDGIHASPAGAALIAKAWREAVPVKNAT